MSYVPLFELAKGGLGRVSVVMRHDGSYERLYVQKRPHAKDPETRAVFLDEARLAGLVRHPNVVGVLDVGEDDEGPYLVMDLVEGAHVGELVQALAGEPMSLAVALEIARQAAEGLHAIHELQTLDGTPLGVIHRDVSPQNLLVGFDGVVRVTDLGIALADQRRATETQLGVLKGKVGYVAPEQLEGAPLDCRADLFALGVVLVEMLTGRRLYQAPTNAEVARAVLEEDPPDLGELRRDATPELVELVFDLLAKRPEARPTDAREVAERLRAIRDEVDEGERLDELMGELFSERRAALRARVREARDRRLAHVLRDRARAGLRRRAAVAGLLGLGAAALLAGGWRVLAPPRPSGPPSSAQPRRAQQVERSAEPVLSTALSASGTGPSQAEPPAAGVEPEHGPVEAASAAQPTDDPPTTASLPTDRPSSAGSSRRTRRARPRVAAPPETPPTTRSEPTSAPLPPTSWWPRE